MFTASNSLTRKHCQPLPCSYQHDQRFFRYTAGSISETIVRTADLAVGTMTAIDQDRDSGSTGITIAFTAPSGFSTTTPSCTTLSSGAVQCTSNLVLGASTTLAFVNSDHGTLTVPIALSSGGLTRAATVNITLLDEPELPTGIVVTLTEGSPLYEYVVPSRSEKESIFWFIMLVINIDSEFELTFNLMYTWLPLLLKTAL